MDKVKALIYLNQCGDKKLESRAIDMMHRHCEMQGYEPAFMFGEDTNCTGISEPIKYMLIGMAAEMKIDVIITMFSGMISTNEKELMDTIGTMDDYGVLFETIGNDMDQYYYRLYESLECDDCSGDADDSSFIANMASMWAADDE